MRPSSLMIGSLLLLAFVGIEYRWLKAVQINLDQIRTQNQQLLQVVADTQSTGVVPQASVSYAETSKGLKQVPVGEGISQHELQFVRQFRGPLLQQPRLSDDDLKVVRDLLHEETLKEFSTKRSLFDASLTDRQALVRFVLARVNGSVATYAIRPALPDNPTDLLLGETGNCSDYSVRTMMVLESFGFRAALIQINTPLLPGHVVVDAYDPVEDTAYLLDANFNVVIQDRNSVYDGFIEDLLRRSKAEREEFIENLSIQTLPVYFRYIDPGPQGLIHTPLTLSELNNIRSGRQHLWQSWLSEDNDTLVAFWQRAPQTKPATLVELREYVSSIPTSFTGSGEYAKRIRVAAGLPD